MIIRVKVKPNAKEEFVEKLNDSEYFVSLREKAQEGKANAKLIKLLSKEFRVSFKDIKIKTLRGRNKLVEIKIN